MQYVAVAVSLGVTAFALVVLTDAIVRIVRVVRLGQPDRTRTDHPRQRAATLLREFLGHNRMLKRPVVAVAHWFVMIGFGALVFTLLTAYGQLFDAEFALPLIGHWHPFEWLMEAIAWLTLLGILTLTVIRQISHPRAHGRGSRFFGSSFWQAYYVEFTIAAIAVTILLIRGLESRLVGDASLFPLTAFIGDAVSGVATSTIEMAVHIIAAVKITISWLFFIVISWHLTMGVAWHRGLAFFNIFFKRHADGAPALGAAKPLTVNGEPVDFENIDDLDEDASLGAGQVEDFSWKGMLDFSTCTECGRCQSQCPAWHTDKPLSPKLLVMQLRDHAFAKAPYLLAGGGTDMMGNEQATAEQLADVPADARAEAERPLVGSTDGDPARPDGGAVIDPDVLWSCTMCGACVEQCPVDIEHVDHILDLRRYQTLIETEFPSELNGLFKNLEKSGNPWGMTGSKRMEWAKDLPFDVRVVGGPNDDDPSSLDEVDWLFWVGCAGAFDDRAKKTTQAVAELLHMAGVSFAVLGDGETCTGDPARRSGNEFLYQQLALQNVEVLREAEAVRVVSTCAHCFNTLKNEYEQLGLKLEVVHHTQLLNRLVRDGKLTPVAPPDGEVAGRPVTYHDPCYLGRHNKVYEPPRELVGALPGVEYREMPRSGSTSFCCGAGGARMWMEERIGKRINGDRTEEALATLDSSGDSAESGQDGASGSIAIGCPFCRVMLSDGLTQAQSDGRGTNVDVVDVAQLLLDGVKRSSTADE
ncbi:(Fe-S)-binding protein [Actinobacteria bacterium YIM 96077]|uniref:Fe-S oxidoreductase n=1 Tax=Phytoactinopolyspora halophila TaxID=1981511 RepID=A0A329R2B7_9ACTN|nr:(Fe-S)-binding protein [Phytoactinopolyspora halophila]AYY11409.1 (Fe-S)-binding protein [Actinobacteria bacterium YIM 96077]RAW18109.1 Fe-S oxidoreductase [Phytoactinopolyspora halophila]